MTSTTVGVPGSPRLPWAQLPPGVREAVEAFLGSPVVEAVSQHGGFSPGVAARLRCADGGTAFVKAVSTQQNVHTPQLHRAEAVVAAALPPEAPAPRFRYCYDDGDWVALVFDVAPGQLPALPWSADDAGRVTRAVAQLSASLTPCPLPGAKPIADFLRVDLTSWQRLATEPPADLDPWEHRNLDRLVAAGDRLLRPGGALDGDTLLHLDLRADNILLEPAERVVFVDWPWAAQGPEWVDVALFVLDPLVSGGHDPQLLLQTADEATGAIGRADPAAITDLVLALAGMWAESSRQPVPAAMPTIRAHQRRFHDAALAWGRSRAGWE